MVLSRRILRLLTRASLCIGVIKGWALFFYLKNLKILPLIFLLHVAWTTSTFDPNSTKLFPTPVLAPSAGSLRKPHFFMPHPFILRNRLLTYRKGHIALDCLTWSTLQMLKQKTAAKGWQCGIIKVHRYYTCVSRHWICRVQEPSLRILNHDLNPNGYHPDLATTNH